MFSSGIFEKVDTEVKNNIFDTVENNLDEKLYGNGMLILSELEFSL